MEFERTAPPAPDLIALIDLGSNAARFVFAQLRRDGSFVILREERVQTRLGGGRDGLLPERAVARTARAAERFVRHVRRHSQPRVLAVATAAVRDAPNREQLLASLRQIGGVSLRVLSGSQEARLGAEAALRANTLRSGAVVDLGGGSLQVTHVRDGRLGSGRSMPLGATRLTQRFLAHDPPTTSELDALRTHVRTNLQRTLGARSHEDAVLALGGSGRALLRLCSPGRGKASSLQREELASLRARLAALPLRDRKELPGMDPQRVDILLAAAVTFEELMDQLGARRLTVCSASVREGVLWREAAMISAPRTPLSQRRRVALADAGALPPLLAARTRTRSNTLVDSL